MEFSQQIVQIVVNGFTGSMLLILMALGLSIVFGILNVVNFSHGELYMLGGFGAWWFTTQMPIGVEPALLRYFIGFVVSVIMVGILGILIERFLLRPVRGKFLEGWIMTLGAANILQAAALVCFGTMTKSVPSIIRGVIHPLGATVSLERVAVVLLGTVVVILALLLIHKTNIGRAIQAVAQDREAASLQGISVDRVSWVTMGIGAALAATAGVLMGPVFMVDPYMGTVPVLKAFVVIILGGIGSVPGSIIGGFIIGFTESISATFIGQEMSYIIVYVSVIIILLSKPMGIMGRELIHE